MTQVYASLIYSNLVRLPAGPEMRGPGDNRILPDIAEKWEWTNPTTVVFTLRRGVRFHAKPPVNGREVTAEDVKYSLERFRARSAIGPRLEPVQSIDVLDRSHRAHRAQGAVRAAAQPPREPGLLRDLAARGRGALQGFQPPGGGHRDRALRAEVVRARGAGGVRAQSPVSIYRGSPISMA